MSVGRIVGEPLWALDVPGDRRARVREVLEDVGLEASMADRFPHEFSGGQRQRIALARALAHRPRVLVGDEPLSALDVTVRAQILELLGELRRRDGLTLVMVSHDIGVVQNLCDQVVVMKDGRVIEHGPTDAVLLAPQEDYTRRLLASIPVIETGPRLSAMISGALAAGAARGTNFGRCHRSRTIRGRDRGGIFAAFSERRSAGCGPDVAAPP